MKDITNTIGDNVLSHIVSPHGLVRGLAVVAVSLPILSGCATERGNIRHAEHARAQIEMVQVQRQASIQEAQMESATNTALVDALARVAEANPQHAPSVAVALAVIGVRGQGGDDDDAPMVTLQQQQNEALEWTKALAPTVGGLISGLGVAAITADVQKNASDNAAKVQMNDANNDVAIVQAVAGLGTAAANSVGVEVGGDYYDLQDEAVVDQSLNTTDSYNTTTATTTSTEVSLNTTLNYDGSQMTLGELISQLQSAGASYSIDLDGDGVADVSEDNGGQTVTIDCSFVFSPQNPNCV